MNERTRDNGYWLKAGKTSAWGIAHALVFFGFSVVGYFIPQ
jgi:hypothetical protein